MINVELDELVDMMVHPCNYCAFIEAGQCSKKNGCEQGIKRYLKEELNWDVEE